MASQDHGIHSFEECVPEGSDYLQQNLGRLHTRRSSLIIREEKMGATKDQALSIQIRSLKRWEIWRTQFLKNLLSILRVWIRNDEVMNEEDDEDERRSLPTKQIKLSIQLSFHDIVFCYAFVYILLMYYAW